MTRPNTDHIDYDALAAASDQFRITREIADSMGLSDVQTLRWVSPVGLTMRVIFRGPEHKKGDAELTFKLRARFQKKGKR